jgi:hypothetical protein
MQAARRSPASLISRRAAEEDACAMSSSFTSPLIYIESDVPEGMTLAEWGRRNAVPRTRRSVSGIKRRARSLLLG